jgi:tetratricopeptide (TPR) repeat protein
MGIRAIVDSVKEAFNQGLTQKERMKRDRENLLLAIKSLTEEGGRIFLERDFFTPSRLREADVLEDGRELLRIAFDWAKVLWQETDGVDKIDEIMEKIERYAKRTAVEIYRSQGNTQGALKLYEAMKDYREAGELSMKEGHRIASKIWYGTKVKTANGWVRKRVVSEAKREMYIDEATKWYLRAVEYLLRDKGISRQGILRLLLTNKFGEYETRNPANIIINSTRKEDKIKFFHLTQNLFKTSEFREKGGDLFREIADGILKEATEAGRPLNPQETSFIREVVFYHEETRYLYPEIAELAGKIGEVETEKRIIDIMIKDDESMKDVIKRYGEKSGLARRLQENGARLLLQGKTTEANIYLDRAATLYFEAAEEADTSSVKEQRDLRRSGIKCLLRCGQVIKATEYALRFRFFDIAKSLAPKAISRLEFEYKKRDEEPVHLIEKALYIAQEVGLLNKEADLLHLLGRTEEAVDRKTKLGRIEEALRICLDAGMYRKLLELVQGMDPKDAIYWTSKMGAQYTEWGNQEENRSIRNKYFERARFLGEICLKINQKERPQENPDVCNIYRSIMVSEEQAGRFDRALEAAKAAIRFAPSDEVPNLKEKARLYSEIIPSLCAHA